MTLCGDWTLVGKRGDWTRASKLRCRSWGCEDCRPLRQAELVRWLRDGQPSHFLTLTDRYQEQGDPAQRLTELLDAWHRLVAMIRRSFPTPAFEYGLVVELTERGWPHLHILARSAYIPQAWLSRRWAALTGSPIVDIRRPNKARIARYVAKYVGKEPIRLGSHKRYSFSRGYRLDGPVSRARSFRERGGRWEIRERDIAAYAAMLTGAGYRVRWSKGSGLVAFKIGAAMAEQPPPAATWRGDFSLADLRTSRQVAMAYQRNLSRSLTLLAEVEP
jgi:hypothetical protein